MVLAALSRDSGFAAWQDFSVVLAGALGDELELEHRGPADQLLRALRVLDAGELDEDLVISLPLDGRLGDAELVDPVADRLERLVDGELPDALFLAVVESVDEVARTGSPEPEAATSTGN